MTWSYESPRGSTFKIPGDWDSVIIKTPWDTVITVPRSDFIGAAADLRRELGDEPNVEALRAVLDRVYGLAHTAVSETSRGLEPEADDLLDVLEEIEEVIETLTDDDLGR